MPITRAEFDAMEPGLQLAVFETVWPAFVDLRRLLCSVDTNGQLHFVIEWNGVPTAADRHDCEYLLREIGQAAFGPHSVCCVTWAEQASSAGYREVMSDEVFRIIATEVAPHRLAAGR